MPDVSFATLSDQLLEDLSGLVFSDPVTHVYNPLRYARAAHDQYCQRFGKGPKPVVLVGMNPGPWGMAQTGVPFGEVAFVRDWMGINAPIGKPNNEHPKRLVSGLSCTRSEVSGRRVWGWAQERFGTPEAFFEQFFVLNYCPLSFMEAGGRNRTPDKLPIAERRPLFEACDRHLLGVLSLLEPEHVIGVGRFAEQRIRAALPSAQCERMNIGRILHPSPASPAANRGWAPQAEADLLRCGVTLP